VARPAPLAPLDLIALGLGVAAAALGIAAHTGPFLVGLAIAVALARTVRARSAPHIVCWLVVPLAIWIGFDSLAFVLGVVCLFGQSLVTTLAARGRPEESTDVEAALRVALGLGAGVTVIALLAFGDIYL
jgi:hypothetical protein